MTIIITHTSIALILFKTPNSDYHPGISKEYSHNTLQYQAYLFILLVLVSLAKKEVAVRAIVDPETCIGCGLCPTLCPEVFRMEGDLAITYTDPVPEVLEDTAQDAADQCPVAAIAIIE